MLPLIVQVPRIEDEIEKAWQNFLCQTIPSDADADNRAYFEAGFRIARTFSVGTLP